MSNARLYFCLLPGAGAPVVREQLSRVHMLHHLLTVGRCARIGSTPSPARDGSMTSARPPGRFIFQQAAPQQAFSEHDGRLLSQIMPLTIRTRLSAAKVDSLIANEILITRGLLGGGHWCTSRRHAFRVYALAAAQSSCEAFCNEHGRLGSRVAALTI